MRDIIFICVGTPTLKKVLQSVNLKIMFINVQLKKLQSFSC